jgi:diguanylate cyclase (GGDEF)-like protein/PAS domain S-box-containing protein
MIGTNERGEDLDGLVELVPDAAILVCQDQVVVAANGRADAIFGAPEGSLRNLALEMLVPEASRRAHRQYVADFFREEQCRDMGSGLRFQGRRWDGVLRPMNIMLNRIRVADRDLTMAVIRDDSERVAIRQMRDDLEAANARLARAQEVGGLGWWEFDCHTERLTWSPMVPAMLGLPEAVEPSLSLLVKQCLREDLAHLKALHQNMANAPGRQLIYRVRRPDGDLRWIQETVDPGIGNRVLGVLRDITTEKVLEEKLRRESVTDELTGLYNRKQFNRDLKSRYSDYSRHGRNASVVMYDFDHFKNINDCHGHLVGDQVLSQAAQIVSAQLRPSDHAYRLGGEEFAIIIANTGVEAVRALAERIRHTIEQAVFRAEDSLVHATISLGLARFRLADTQFEDIFRRADEALYQSKSRSRNTISVIE